MVLTPLIRGLLGIDVDVPRARVTLAPHLPPDWDSVSVDNVPVGQGTLSFTVRRSAGAITVVAHRRGADRRPIELEFSPALPLGAVMAPAGTSVQRTPGDVHATVRVSLVDSASATVRYDGGWSIQPPSMPATIGSRSRAPRIISERLERRANGDNYVVALEGIAGDQYAFVVRASEARGTGIRVAIGTQPPFVLPLERGTAVVAIRFPTAGANDDGYTTTAVSFSQIER